MIVHTFISGIYFRFIHQINYARSTLPVVAHLVPRLFSSLATRGLTDLMRVPCPVGAGFTSFAELLLRSLIGLMDVRVIFFQAVLGLPNFPCIPAYLIG